MSLNSLPNDLLVEISSCVAASSLSDIRNLEMVSKSFQNSCDDGHIFKLLCLNEAPLFPWVDTSREKCSRLFRRCLRNGNPEALYRKGLVICFRLENDNFRMYSDGQGHRGFKYLAKAAEKGNQKAQYVYGMMLICLGDKARKEKRFKVLSSLIKPLMSSTKKEMEKLRDDIRGKILWRGKPAMKLIKSRYVREKCNCDGQTKKFLEKNCGWNGYDEDNDIVTSSSFVCEICLWHYEVELFFANIEK